MTCLSTFSSPQLEKLHSGKVRESFRVSKDTRAIVVTDRISAFDHVLTTPIPHKGAVLNGISSWWFGATRHIVDNHFIENVDPQVALVREATPIRIEMVVRGYLTGSMWRAYEKGKRSFSGIEVGEGLRKNQRLPSPILTPTTKEESDREITPREIVSGGWADRSVYEQMEAKALELFRFGTEQLAKKGLILVDTKYEFGIAGGKLILIDEIHTPDSSRFWSAQDYERDPAGCVEMDKEYVRSWLMRNKEGERYPTALPPAVIAETSQRYVAMYERVTGASLDTSGTDVRERIYRSLLRAGLIKDGYVAIFMGSPVDLPHCQRMKEFLERYDVMVDLRVVSAHKNGEDVARIAREYNEAVEPGAAIAVAGLSNGLGGALTANVALPVFNCPPFKDQTDLMVNINSSLMMPSRVPAATVLGPEAAALAALRSLNLRRLHDRFLVEIGEIKDRLRAEDRRIRGR